MLYIKLNKTFFASSKILFNNALTGSESLTVLTEVS